MYSIWHEMLKIASASGAEPQTPLGSLRRSPRPPSRERLLAFSNRSFAPSALELSPIFSRSVPPKLDVRLCSCRRPCIKSLLQQNDAKVLQPCSKYLIF